MDLSDPYVMAFAAGTTLVLLVAYRVGQRLLSPQRAVAKVFSDDQAAPKAPEGEPPPLSVTAAAMRGPDRARRFLGVGEVLAIFGIAASVVKNCLVGDLKRDAMMAAAYGFAGLFLLVVFGHLGVRLLFGAKLTAEVERGNEAAGIAAGGHYVAVGLLVSRAVAGTDLRGLGLAVVFFVLAQVAHQLLVGLFRALTTYDDAEQIMGENAAAALSYVGVSVAVALVIARALEGDFESWPVSLRGFGIMVAYGLLLYPVRQIVVQTLLLGGRLAARGGAIDKGISVHRSMGTGSMEAATLIATALTVTSLS
jgi:uncharacterized membrane protein YjfL (UPF0719 family)